MSDINAVRERLDAVATEYAGPLHCQWLAEDIRTMLADHARLQADVLSMQEFIGPSLLSYWAAAKKAVQP